MFTKVWWQAVPGPGSFHHSNTSRRQWHQLSPGHQRMMITKRGWWLVGWFYIQLTRWGLDWFSMRTCIHAEWICKLQPCHIIILLPLFDAGHCGAQCLLTPWTILGKGIMGAGSTPSLLLFDLMVALKQLIREWTGDHPLGPLVWHHPWHIQNEHGNWRWSSACWSHPILGTIRGNPVHHHPFDPSQRPCFLWHFECCWLQLHA